MKRLMAVAALAALVAACGHKAIDVGALSSASDQVVWDAAQKAIERREWDNARQYLKRIVDALIA